MSPRHDNSTESSTVTKENHTVTSLRHFARRLKSFAPPAISGNHSGAEEQSRADRCAASEIRAKRGKDAGSPHSVAMGTTEDAAPRSSVASARARKRGLVGCVAVAMGLFLTATSVPAASAAGTESPWWNLNTSIRPAVINQGAEATIYVRAANLGNACTATSGPGEDGKFCTADDEGIIPTTLTATMPAGMEIVEEEGEPRVSIFALPKPDLQPNRQKDPENEIPLAYCSVVAQQVSCQTQPGASYFQQLFEVPPYKEAVENNPALKPFIEAAKRREFAVPPFAPYEYFEMRVRVKDESAAPGAPLSTEVSGGGADPLARTNALPIGPGAPPFGVEEYALRPEAQGGDLDPRAGAHPYQLTATFNLNQNANEAEPGFPEAYARPPAMPRNLHRCGPAETTCSGSFCPCTRSSRLYPHDPEWIYME